MQNWVQERLNKMIESKTLTATMAPYTPAKNTRLRQPNNPPVLAQVDLQSTQSQPQPQNQNQTQPQSGNSFGNTRLGSQKIDELVSMTNARILKIFNNFRSGGLKIYPSC